MADEDEDPSRLYSSTSLSAFDQHIRQRLALSDTSVTAREESIQHSTDFRALDPAYYPDRDLPQTPGPVDNEQPSTSTAPPVGPVPSTGSPRLTYPIQRVIRPSHVQPGNIGFNAFPGNQWKLRRRKNATFHHNPLRENWDFGENDDQEYAPPGTAEILAKWGLEHENVEVILDNGVRKNKIEEYARVDAAMENK